jgi:uncharacterized protein YcaQ
MGKSVVGTAEHPGVGAKELGSKGKFDSPRPAPWWQWRGEDYGRTNLWHGGRVAQSSRENCLTGPRSDVTG